MALTEELQCDEYRGMLLNGDMFGYRVPDQLHVPKIEAFFVDSEDPYGPKSLGELPSIPVSAAVDNAIFNVVGARCPNPFKSSKPFGRSSQSTGVHS